MLLCKPLTGQNAGHPDQYLQAEALYQEAKYREALELTDELIASSKKSSNTAFDGYNLRGDCHLALSNFAAAIDAYQQALQIPGLDTIQLAETWQKLGHYYVSTYEYDKALQILDQVLTIRVRHFGSDHPKVADTYTNLGLAYLEKGDVGKAHRFFKQVLSIRSTHLPDLHSGLALSHLNLGNSYYLMSQIPEAKTAYIQSLSIYERIYSSAHPAVANAYTGWGNCLWKERRFAEAAENHKQALAIYKQYFGQDHIKISRSHNNLANCQAKSGDYKNAKWHYTKALDGLAKISQEKHSLAARINNNLGNLHYGQGNIETGISYFAKALHLLQYLPAQSTGIKNYSSATDAISSLSGIAHGQLMLYQKGNNTAYLQKALEKYLEAIDVMDYQRTRTQEEQSKQAVGADFNFIYEKSLEVCWKLFQLQPSNKYAAIAFTISEKSKSRILLEALRKSKAEQFAGVPDSLIQLSLHLEKSISLLEKRLDREAKAQELEDSLFALKQGYDQLILQLEKDFPAYFQLRYNVQVESPKSVQQNILKADQALVEYFVGEAHIYYFVLTPDSLFFDRIDKLFPLDGWVAQLRDGMQGYSQTGDHYREYNDLYVEAATYLYKKLWEQLTPYLLHRVIVVPDGVLNYLPFEVLLRQVPDDSGRFKSHEYILREHILSYCYSATLLREMMEKNRVVTHPLPGVFAPLYAVGNNCGFAPLHFNEKEADFIHESIGGDLFKGKNVTKTQFVQSAENYHLLHLATHGHVNDDEDAYSYLTFSCLDDGLENERLFTKEIYHLKLSAELVTLSACQAGIGTLQKGEGMISLARGFSYAGAKTVLATLWNVNDEKTRQVMSLFYQNLKRGLEKDKALHQAKLDFINRVPHDEAAPYFWAAFISIGETSQVNFDEKLNFLHLLFGLCLLMLFGYFINRKFSSPRNK